MSTLHLERKARVRDAILAVLARAPGQTAEQINKTIGGSLSSTRAVLSRLTQHGGVVARFRRGRDYVYTLASQIGTTLPVKEPEAVSADVSALERRLAELEAFKAKAIAKHPDLSPIDYEACRPALVAFYTKFELLTAADEVSDGEPLDELDIDYLEAILAAAKLLPENAGA